MSTTHTLRFSALDTWFFRESRPFNAIGGSELASIFPPSPRTLMGAVRGAIGDALNADWRDFHQKKWKYQLADGKCLSELIGYGDDIGPLTLAGPWLVHSDERLYPVPLCLLERSEGGRKKCIRLCIGPATHTPLGKVRLPELPPGNAGAKTLERVWVSGTGLARVLAGDIPKDNELRRAAELFTEEPRLGIARDNSKRVTGDGMLYQTRHLRPKGGLMIEAEIQHLPADVNLADRLIRLGGEGRLAHLELRQGGGVLPPVPKANTDTRGLILVLLTPARLGEGREGWLPPGFVAAEENGARVWKGRIADVVLTLHAAVIGKTLREGGWNLAEHKPRDVVSLVPAGSCYYVTVEDDITDAIKKLHGAHISDEKKHEREFGRGQIACGLWNKDEY
ncbi:MAG: type III-B CRISPR module-associated protein Cmr3 [Elusimicrobiota bacterium]